MMKKYTLQELRENKKMTLQEVGDKMGGISRQMVKMWENGTRTPSLTYIEKYLSIFGVKFEQVVWRADEK